MDETHTRNRALTRILEEMLAAHEQAGDWVETDSALDPESQKLMGDMNRGDRESIQAFMNWVEGLQQDLPIKMDSSDGGRTWTMAIDSNGRDGLSDRDSDMLDAMAYMLFDGPEPGSGNTSADDLLGLGLPEQLRRDLSDS